MTLFWILAACVTVMIVGGLRSRHQLAALKARGIYPETGTASMADVKRLLDAGHSTFAIRCYREIHHVGLRDAKAAVESLRA